jgi:hypothetical protein
MVVTTRAFGDLVCDTPLTSTSPSLIDQRTEYQRRASPCVAQAGMSPSIGPKTGAPSGVPRAIAGSRAGCGVVRACAPLTSTIQTFPRRESDS